MTKNYSAILSGMASDGLDREINNKGKNEGHKARMCHGTLFVREVSIALTSHRLDSDRFEPLYAYRSETMPR